MPQQYANTRNVTTVGNSVGVTVPPEFLQEAGLVDDDGSPLEDAEFSVQKTDDGAIRYKPVGD